MIIECTNCNKKFRVDDELIPENGREIILFNLFETLKDLRLFIIDLT